MAPSDPETTQHALIKPATLDRWPRGIAYQKGFRILGTPIGFGDASGSGLRFLASLGDRAPRKGERLLASLILSSAFSGGRRGVDILGLSYGQTIRLGQMALRLYPAGVGPGAAQLEVSVRTRRILYCGGIRLASPLIAATPEVPRCDLLLLDTDIADPKPPAPATSAKALGQWLKQCIDGKQRAFVVFGNLAAAFDAVYVAKSAGMPLRVQRRLFHMVRGAAAVLPLGHAVLRLDQQVNAGEAALVAARDWPRSRFFASPKKQVAFVGPGRKAPPWADAAFRMGEAEDRPGTLAYIRETGAGQVALGDRCADALTAPLQEAGIAAFRLTHPTQMPLPFRI